jgi:hypothetical protein
MYTFELVVGITPRFDEFVPQNRSPTAVKTRSLRKKRLGGKAPDRGPARAGA